MANTKIELEFIKKYKSFRVDYVDKSTGDIRALKVVGNKAYLSVSKNTKKHRFYLRVLGKTGSVFAIKLSDNVKAPVGPLERTISSENIYTGILKLEIK